MNTDVLKDVKKKLEVNKDANLVSKFVAILGLVKPYAEKILIKSKAIEELELKDAVIKEAIITVANNNVELEKKLTFFIKFLSKKTFSCVPVKEMDKDTFVYLREYLKANSGITPDPKEVRIAKQEKSDYKFSNDFASTAKVK